MRRTEVARCEYSEYPCSTHSRRYEFLKSYGCKVGGFAAVYRKSEVRLCSDRVFAPLGRLLPPAPGTFAFALDAAYCPAVLYRYDSVHVLTLLELRAGIVATDKRWAF